MREMKDSGIEWIGEIPKEWDLIKCKYVTEVYTGNSIKDEEKGLYEDPVDSIPYISTKDIDATFNSVAYDNGLFIKKIDTSFVRANKGDTLMCIEGGSAGRKKAILDRTVCFVNKLCCFHPTRINPVYLFYILNSPHYEEEFSVNMSGLIGGVSKGKLMNFILPYPCYDTQHRIADYLDDKCGKIDRYIEQQKQVIEKLKAYKQSVITEAVTKGLDPTVPMKDSGVEWIGEIPDGWEVVKAKYCILITNGSDPKTQGDTPVYGSGSSSFKTCGEFKEGPCVLIGRKGATLHIPHYIEGKYWNVDTAFDVKVLDRMELKYYYYLAICFDYKIYMSQTTLPSMTQTSYENMMLPIPSDYEQRQITNHLDKKCFSIDLAIKEKQTLIEKLTEYKKSLIYEVVTGKKEV